MVTTRSQAARAASAAEPVAPPAPAPVRTKRATKTTATPPPPPAQTQLSMPIRKSSTESKAERIKTGTSAIRPRPVTRASSAEAAAVKKESEATAKSDTTAMTAAETESAETETAETDDEQTAAEERAVEGMLPGEQERIDETAVKNSKTKPVEPDRAEKTAVMSTSARLAVDEQEERAKQGEQEVKEQEAEGAGAAGEVATAVEEESAVAAAQGSSDGKSSAYTYWDWNAVRKLRYGKSNGKPFALISPPAFIGKAPEPSANLFGQTSWPIIGQTCTKLEVTNNEVGGRWPTFSIPCYDWSMARAYAEWSGSSSAYALPFFDWTAYSTAAAAAAVDRLERLSTCLSISRARLQTEKADATRVKAISLPVWEPIDSTSCWEAVTEEYELGLEYRLLRPPPFVSEEGPLPAGWDRRSEPGTGRVYFWSRHSQKIKYRLPKRADRRPRKRGVLIKQVFRLIQWQYEDGTRHQG